MIKKVIHEYSGYWKKHTDQNQYQDPSRRRKTLNRNRGEGEEGSYSINATPPLLSGTLLLSIPSDFCVVSFLALCLNFRQNNKLFLIQAKIHNIPTNPWAVTIKLYSCWVDDCREGRELNN